MFYLILLFIIIAVVFGISYYAFRLTFLAPPHLDANHYYVPDFDQFDAVHEGIKKSVARMAARPYESINITSFDGSKLFARYYHVADDAPVHIMFHGYKSSSILDCSGVSHFACQLGHNAIVVDQRSHGQSEGTVITFGVKERKDCLAWIEYAMKRFGNDVPIMLFGLSMGAATVLMVNDLKLPKNVKGIIADCPYSSPKEIIMKVAKEMHFPPHVMLPFVWLGGRIFGHFNLFESSAIEAIKTSELPILILHGNADELVPCDMSQHMLLSGAKDIRLELFEGAGHGLSYIILPDKYEKTVVEFIQKCLSKFS